MSFIIGIIIIPLALLVLVSYLFILWNKKSDKKKLMASNVLDSDETMIFPRPIREDWVPDHATLFDLEDMVANRMVEGIPIDPVFEERKNSLGKGNTAKLRFNIFVAVEFGTSKDIEVAVEELWVLIEDQKEDMYYGILASEPEEKETNLRQGFGFWFHANHIVEIG